MFSITDSHVTPYLRSMINLVRPSVCPDVKLKVLSELPSAPPGLLIQDGLVFSGPRVVFLGLHVDPMTAVGLFVVVPPLQVLRSRVQTEQSGNPAQDGVVPLEVGDPLTQGGPVSPPGHAHGEDGTLIH